MDIYQVEFKRHESVSVEKIVIASKTTKEATDIFKRIYPKRLIVEVNKIK